MGGVVTYERWLAGDGPGRDGTPAPAVDALLARFKACPTAPAAALFISSCLCRETVTVCGRGEEEEGRMHAMVMDGGRAASTVLVSIQAEC